MYVAIFNIVFNFSDAFLCGSTLTHACRLLSCPTGSDYLSCYLCWNFCFVHDECAIIILIQKIYTGSSVVRFHTWQTNNIGIKNSGKPLYRGEHNLVQGVSTSHETESNHTVLLSGFWCIPQGGRNNNESYNK